jgi:hypothetical protein
MSDNNELTQLATKFLELYRCNPNVHGETKLTGKFRDRDGKCDSKSYLVKSGVTVSLWEEHIRGDKRIGCTPLQEDSSVFWGALDVDVYQKEDTLEKLNEKVNEHTLPFVVCRSKSGGAHVYLFLSEPVAAKDMIDKLKAFSAFFGQGVSEIYPKQPKIGSRKDDSKYGNWLNMPYSGNPTLQYAFNNEGEALDPNQFIDAAQEKRMTSEQFHSLQVPNASSEIFPEGPPCLNYIFSERTQESESRNITLANVIVYLKKANPTEWKQLIHKYNRMFSEPLTDRELEAIIASYGKKDYKYQCAQEPLCRFCDAKQCGQTKYGIGGEDFMPNNRSLVQLKSDPPLWYLTLDDTELQLSTAEFDNFSLFNQRVMERLLYKFPMIKQEDWTKQQNLLLKNCTQIDIPFEMTPVGQLVELVSSFCNSAVEDYKHIKHGPIKRSDGNYLFRMSDLKDHLEQQRFKDMPSNKILSVLKKVLKAEPDRVQVDNVNTRCWRIHQNKLDVNNITAYPELIDNTTY